MRCLVADDPDSLGGQPTGWNLGCDPFVFIEEGIGRFVAWLREHEGRLM